LNSSLPDQNEEKRKKKKKKKAFGFFSLFLSSCFPLTDYGKKGLPKKQKKKE
jgi:hypothetical protein